MFCAFVDFTKAFDYVVRDIVWYKLLRLGIGGKILNIIMSMYKHVKSKVKLHNVVGKGLCVRRSTRGVSLSFFFAMYFNDLEEELRLKGGDGIDIGMLKLVLLLYADDIIFCTVIRRTPK